MGDDDFSRRHRSSDEQLSKGLSGHWQTAVQLIKVGVFDPALDKAEKRERERDNPRLPVLNAIEERRERIEENSET